MMRIEAARDYRGPQQNIVLAETGGRIGFYAPAVIPIRQSGDGSVPVPGWSGDHDWIGEIPFEDLPHVVDPPRGYIVTANEKVVGDDYPYFPEQRLAARLSQPAHSRPPGTQP